MITQSDQMDLFRLIARGIKKNITCYAFGGTAMMFYGYKDGTKDIDLLFEKEEDRQDFIQAIEKLGFEKSDPIKIYIPEKLRDKNRPLMFKRGESRFDLFVKQIFKTLLSPQMQEDLYAVHEFKEEHTLTVKVLRKEHIAFLKAITERQNDFDDIKNIISQDKGFDWQYLVDEAIWQHKHGDNWALLDIEKTLKELKRYFFIEEKYFKQIYSAAEK
ncbi:MAG TPA: hypothetical protein VJ461_01795, partial [Candidatus Nanoarchaeia archaeon]|nr:hypothetical protein [Candidatus Nanoarchaeia archaeon]